MLREGADSTVDVVKSRARWDLSDQEPLSPAAADQAGGRGSQRLGELRAQSQALQSAKRDKDIIRATCLDDKLSQCNANLQNIKRRRRRLSDAIAEGDSGRGQSRVHRHRRPVSEVQDAGAVRKPMRGPGPVRHGRHTGEEEVDLFAPDENPAVITRVPDWPVPYIPPPVSGVS